MKRGGEKSLVSTQLPLDAFCRKKGGEKEERGEVGKRGCHFSVWRGPVEEEGKEGGNESLSPQQKKKKKGGGGGRKREKGVSSLKSPDQKRGKQGESPFRTIYPNAQGGGKQGGGFERKLRAGKPAKFTNRLRWRWGREGKEKKEEKRGGYFLPIGIQKKHLLFSEKWEEGKGKKGRERNPSLPLKWGSLYASQYSLFLKRKGREKPLKVSWRGEKGPEGARQCVAPKEMKGEGKGSPSCQHSQKGKKKKKKEYKKRKKDGMLVTRERDSKQYSS